MGKIKVSFVIEIDSTEYLNSRGNQWVLLLNLGFYCFPDFPLILLINFFLCLFVKMILD